MGLNSEIGFASGMISLGGLRRLNLVRKVEGGVKEVELIRQRSCVAVEG